MHNMTYFRLLPSSLMELAGKTLKLYMVHVCSSSVRLLFVPGSKTASEFHERLEQLSVCICLQD